MRCLSIFYMLFTFPLEMSFQLHFLRAQFCSSLIYSLDFCFDFVVIKSGVPGWPGGQLGTDMRRCFDRAKWRRISCAATINTWTLTSALRFTHRLPLFITSIPRRNSTLSIYRSSAFSIQTKQTQNWQASNKIRYFLINCSFVLSKISFYFK